MLKIGGKKLVAVSFWNKLAYMKEFEQNDILAALHEA
jgi:hypothetical protein